MLSLFRVRISGNTHFHQCCHHKISSSEAKKVFWLKPNSQAFLTLGEVALNIKQMKDIAKITDFCHTGRLEVYHSMMPKYCPKRENFSHQGMVAKTQLTALDNNHNTGRGQAVIKSGAQESQARKKLCFPKESKRRVAKPLTQKKSYEYLRYLFAQAVQRCEEGNRTAQVIPILLPRNIASEPTPQKADIIENHRSRFNRSIKSHQEFLCFLIY